MRTKNLLALALGAVLCAFAVTPAQAGLFDWFRKKKEDKPAAEAAAESTAPTAAAGSAAQVTAAGSTVQTAAEAAVPATASKVEKVAAALTSENALKTAQSVKTALSSATSYGNQLKGLLGDNAQLNGLLDQALSAVKKGDDLLALDKLKELGESAQLTADQKELVDGLKKDFQVIALGRNFADSGPVSAAIASLESGDTTKAVGSLGDALKDASLSDKQRGILTKVIDSYAGSLKKFLPF